MQYSTFSFLFILLAFSIINCSSKGSDEEEGESRQDPPKEIIFYTNGSIFSPVIVLNGSADITWVWDDNSISNVTNPTKDYGTPGFRKNKLVVNPWSALRRINIGYDAGDGGNPEIEFVSDQQVSLIENLELAAPYLKEWCSSYNNLTSLNFDDFINLEIIECYYSFSLKNINLKNTPKLKRVCFEDNDLLALDMLDCNSLEDVRGALNNFSTVIFPTHSEKIWHICIRNSPIVNPHLFNDLSQFPMITHLWIPDINQQGELKMPRSNFNGDCSIWGWNNKYSTLDLRGAFQNADLSGYVNMSFNVLTNVEITGCIQIKELYLQNNKLESAAIDQILKQVDEFDTYNGIIDLRNNAPPSPVGLAYKENLEKRGWSISTELLNTSSIQSIEEPFQFKIYSDSDKEKIIIHVDKIPSEGILVEVRNILGKKLFGQRIFTEICEFPVDKHNTDLYFITLKGKDITKTKKVILSP